MKRLILIRHAQAMWGMPGVRDFDRRLDDSGKREALVMGQRLASRSYLPDAILSSPALRARETGEMIAAEIGFPPARIGWEPSIYEAETGDLLRLIHDLNPSWQSVFLVGHNPGVTDLANLLSAAGLSGLPTCGAVGMEFSAGTIDQWSDVKLGCGRVFYFNYPEGFSG